MSVEIVEITFAARKTAGLVLEQHESAVTDTYACAGRHANRCWLHCTRDRGMQQTSALRQTHLQPVPPTLLVMLGAQLRLRRLR